MSVLISVDSNFLFCVCKLLLKETHSATFFLQSFRVCTSSVYQHRKVIPFPPLPSTIHPLAPPHPSQSTSRSSQHSLHICQHTCLNKKQRQPQRSYTRTSCAHVRLDPTGRTSERTGRSTRRRHRRSLVRRIPSPSPGPARTRTRSGSGSGGAVGDRIGCVGEICESCGSATDRRG